MPDKTDEALQNVRDTFENAVEGAEQVSESAKQEVREAIDDLEGRIEGLRDSN